MVIVTPSQRLERVGYVRSFDTVGHPGCGYAFACDKEGNLLPPSCSEAEVNRAKVFAAIGIKYLDRGIQSWSAPWTAPAIGICEKCGHLITLELPIANSCDGCDAEYTMSGQRLAPREQWGEETGESLADIFAGEYDPEEIRYA
jgi:hypothetical protein